MVVDAAVAGQEIALLREHRRQIERGNFCPLQRGKQRLPASLRLLPRIVHPVRVVFRKNRALLGNKCVKKLRAHLVRRLFDALNSLGNRFRLLLQFLIGQPRGKARRGQQDRVSHHNVVDRRAAQYLHLNGSIELEQQSSRSNMVLVKRLRVLRKRPIPDAPCGYLRRRCKRAVFLDRPAGRAVHEFKHREHQRQQQCQ